MSAERLPCPFCGSAGFLSRSRDGEVCNIRCRNWGNGCMGAGPNEYDEGKAIAGWNNRATQARPAPVPDEQAGEWQWVPKVPTEEMCRAAVVFANGNAVYKNVAAEALKIEEGIYAEVFAAMLAAAPSRPAAAEKREPLTKRDIERALLAASWPFPLPVKSFDAVHFARAIERAHGIE